MRNFVLAVALIILMPFNAISGAPTDGFADIVEPLMPAVVNINTVQYVKKGSKRILPNDNLGMEQFNELFERFGIPFFSDELPSNPKATALGSGFIIDPEGYIVTNYHVINNADEVSIKLNDNREFIAKVVGSDQKTDLALLKIDSKTPLPFVRFGNSSISRVGDWVIAIGNPFGLGGTVTAGIISSKSRDIDLLSSGLVDDYIQTDASINAGNSGGPLFNMNGEVIGVNTAIYTPTGTNIGIGFAIPSNVTQSIIKQLKANGKIERGKLGIRIQELTPEIMDGLGIKNIEGVLIATVDPGSSAEKAGMKSGDIIVEYNNQPIKNSRKLQILVAETPVNTEVLVKVLRDGKTKEVKASIQEFKDLKAEPGSQSSPNDKDIKGFVINGVKFSDITSDVSESFHIEDLAGVVVLSNKAKDSWRTLQQGDIVKSVNQVEIKNLAEFKAEYKKAKSAGKKNIVMLVKRGAMTIFMALPLI